MTEIICSQRIAGKLRLDLAAFPKKIGSRSSAFFCARSMNSDSDGASNRSSTEAAFIFARLP